MRADRVSYDFTNWGNSTNTSRMNGAQTPRNKNKFNTVNQNQRKSISPIRNNNMPQNDRISSSPLRVPLQQAISRCVRDRSVDKSASRRTLAKSSRRQQGSFILQAVKKISYEDQINNRNIKAHSQTLKFLKKYFNLDYIISTEQFMSKILQQYGNLWDNQNLQHFLQQFTYKVNQIFGVDGISPSELIIKTKSNGMLGLIMTILKEINEQELTRNSNYQSFSRNPQVMSINKSFEQRLYYNTNQSTSIENIKNVVQQFMQSMYQCMQAQIYNKFNIQMRRMVLKYRQAQKIIKKVNEKITTHADFFDLQQKLRKQKKWYQQKLNQAQKHHHKLQAQITKQKDINNQLKNTKFRVEQQNRKLKQSMQKLQQALINKALEGSGSGNNSNTTSQLMGLSSMNNNNNNNSNCNDPTLSRRTTSPFTDRTQQYSNINNTNNISQTQGMNEPFSIKIDTHIIQKDLGPPSTYTTTMFGMNNNLGCSNNNNNMMPMHVPLSPLKKEENKENMPFMEGRYSYSPYGSRLGNTRMY